MRTHDVVFRAKGIVEKVKIEKKRKFKTNLVKSGSSANYKCLDME